MSGQHIDSVCAARAEAAANSIRNMLGKQLEIDMGLVLGTGWSDSLTLEDRIALPFNCIKGFEGLRPLEGHPRQLVIGDLGDKRVAMLRGRVHMNEAPSGSAVPSMARLQIEMLCHLGMNNIVLTCAAGSLRDDLLAPGDIVLMDGIFSLLAPQMPLYAGEFCSPEDALDEEWRERVAVAEPAVKTGGHAYVRGPWFEGRRYDKPFLTNHTRCLTVGMSVLPELCIASLYNVAALGIAAITNSATESHDHQTNVARAKAQSERFAKLLELAISKA